MVFAFSRSRLAIILTVLCVVVLLWFVIPGAPGEFSTVPAGRLLNAIYEGYAFSTAEDEMHIFRTTANALRDRGTPLPFCRNHLNDAYCISELKEQVVVNWVTAEQWDTSKTGETSAYHYGKTWIGFRRGDLSFITLSKDTPELYIGPTKDGPWVQLPVSRRRMIEVFGQPKRWTWSKNATGP